MLIGDKTIINTIWHPSLSELAKCDSDTPSISHLYKSEASNSKDFHNLWLIINDLETDNQHRSAKSNNIMRIKPAWELYSKGYIPKLMLKQGTYSLYYFSAKT